ncbi:conserved hypothetical protein [Thiocapsa sp. KS1]|nr:conserved hypothetical protein [Thiocapsa sp. KS1]
MVDTPRLEQFSGASRTYVVSVAAVGYYCLASGMLTLREAYRSIRHNMPDPVPMAILGLVVVDRTLEWAGLGVALPSNAPGLRA